MGVNGLPKTVIRHRRDCDLNPGPTAPESMQHANHSATEPPVANVKSGAIVGVSDTKVEQHGVSYATTPLRHYGANSVVA